MGRALASSPALMAAVLGLASCAPDHEAQAMDAVAKTCLEQAGRRYDGASAALMGGYAVGPLCSATLTPLPEGDTCGAPSPGGEVCRVLYYWFTADHAVCQGGACTCELRLRKNDLDSMQRAATVCAVRFLWGSASP